MNTTRAKEKLCNVFSKELRIELPDGSTPSDGCRILVYGMRTEAGSSPSWSVKGVQRADEAYSIGAEVEYRPEYQQLILEGTLRVSGNRKPFSLEDVSVAESSAVEKPKEEIKHQLVQLWHVGLPNVYVTDTADRQVADLDGPVFNSPIRGPMEDDFKLTTIRKAAMTMGRTKDLRFKLGVNWSSYHFVSETSLLKTLTHELCHLLHQNHRKEFWISHAEMVHNLTKSQSRRARVERLFDEEINWDELKAQTLDGVHKQAQELEIRGFQHRKAAADAVVEEMEEILDYQYDVGKCMHLHPPTTMLRSEWIEAGDDRPEEVELHEARSLEWDGEYTDKELYEYLQSLKGDNIHDPFLYTSDDIPVVEGTTVVENEKLAALYNRMRAREGVPEMQREGFQPDVTLPVKRADNSVAATNSSTTGAAD